MGEGGNGKHDKHATRGGSAGRARAGGARVGDAIEIFARLLKNPTPHNFTFLDNLVDPSCSRLSICRAAIYSWALVFMKLTIVKINRCNIFPECGFIEATNAV